MTPAQMASNDRTESLPRPAATPQLARGSSLSAREWQILQCLIDGMSNKSTALKLNLSPATVKVYVRLLLRKLHAQNRTQLAIWGLTLRTANAQSFDQEEAALVA